MKRRKFFKLGMLAVLSAPLMAEMEKVDLGYNFSGVSEFNYEKALVAIDDLKLSYPYVDYYMEIKEETVKDGIPTVFMEVQSVTIGKPEDLISVYEKDGFKHWIDPVLKVIMPRKY